MEINNDKSTVKEITYELINGTHLRLKGNQYTSMEIIALHPPGCYIVNFKAAKCKGFSILLIYLREMYPIEYSCLNGIYTRYKQNLL